jgi:VWFA-related protein
MKIERFLGSNSGGRVYTVRKLKAQIRISDVLFLAVSFVLAAWYAFAQTADNVTFKTGVHLVVVPVVVRDSKGQAVGSLTKDDFQLFDKGKRQQITKFTVEKSGGQVTESTDGGRRDNPADQPAVAPESFIAYLFDDIHLNFADLAQVRDGAGRNIDASHPTDRMAIFTTSGQGMLDFTSDRAKLHAALLELRPHPLPSSGDGDCPDVSYYVADLIRNQGDQAALEAVTAETMSCMRLNPREIDMARGIARDTARRALQRGLNESRTSLLVLKDAIRRISMMPGQRIIILASPGFLVGEDMREDELDVVDRATRASVVICSLDARGLYTSSPAGGVNEENGAGLPQYQKAEAVVRSGVLAEMAAGTGGTLIQNSNDFEGGFRRLVTPPKYIYMLGFEPEDLKTDGSFHVLKVKLKSAGRLSLQARHGYFVPKDRESELPIAKNNVDSAVYSREEIQGLPVELHTEFSRSSDTEVKLKVAASVGLNQPLNGGDLTLVLALFDNNGNVVGGWQKTMQVRLNAESKHRHAINVNSSFDVKSGNYLIRLVVRDGEGRLIATKNEAAQIP